MTIRKRNDSPKSGCGVDGTLGETFSKRGTDPWNSNPRGNYNSPQGRGAYQDADASFLTNKLPYESNSTTNDSYDVFDAVEGQSSDSGHRAVRSRGQP